MFVKVCPIVLNSFTLSARSHTIKMHPDDDYHFNLLFISILFTLHAGAASVLNPDAYIFFKQAQTDSVWN